MTILTLPEPTRLVFKGEVETRTPIPGDRSVGGIGPLVYVKDEERLKVKGRSGVLISRFSWCRRVPVVPVERENHDVSDEGVGVHQV